MKPKQRKKNRDKSPRRHTRKEYARMSYIHEQIQSGTYPTVEELAEHLRVSTRTVERDIKSLKEDWRMPIEVSRKDGRTGYYYSRPVARKLARTINEQELLAIALSDRGMAQYPVKKSQKRFSVAFDKIAQLAKSDLVDVISTVENSFDFRPFAPEEIDVDFLLTAAESIRSGNAVRFRYMKHLAETLEWKFVNVYRIVCTANSWYIIGYDREKDVVRTYLISRAQDLEVTDETFENPNFNLNEYLKGCFIVMKGNESHDVVVEFDAWAAVYIRNRSFVQGQKIEELPNGRLRISFWLSCLSEVEMWVRHWGKNAVVIGPEPLRERMRNYKDWLGQTYGSTVTG